MTGWQAGDFEHIVLYGESHLGDAQICQWGSNKVAIHAV